MLEVVNLLPLAVGTGSWTPVYAVLIPAKFIAEYVPAQLGYE
jgi:hypothetical protein